MWPAQMQERCSGSAPVEVARLADHRFVINQRGVATVVPARGSAVLGVLWTVTSDHIRSLDGFEGVAKGNYVREVVQVYPEDAGAVVDAWVYIACHSQPGRPRDGYLERVIDGARHFDVDASYVKESLTPWGQAARVES